MIINNTWSLLAATPPPDWNQYVKSGSYQPNIQMIQQINRAETDSNMIRLGTGELSPDLLPTDQMRETLNGRMSSRFTLGYSEPKGSLYLREIISEHLKRKGL